MELLFYLFYEVFLTMASWALGVVVIKVFTLGKGRVGHLKYCTVTLNEKERRDFASQTKLNADELKAEVFYANRTFWVGFLVLCSPVIALILFIFSK